MYIMLYIILQIMYNTIMNCICNYMYYICIYMYMYIYVHTHICFQTLFCLIGLCLCYFPSYYAFVCAKSLQSCLTLCPMDYSLPGSSVHGILQARIQEWVVMPSSRGSSHQEIKPELLKSSVQAVGFFTTGATWNAPGLLCFKMKWFKFSTFVHF